MNALASLAATASGGGACLILWQRATDSGSAHAPADPGWEPALWAILGMLSRQGAGDGRGHGAGAALNATFRMSAAEVSLRCGRALPGQMRLEAYGVASSASPTAHASIVILAPQGTAPAQGEALLHLVRRQALAEIELSEEAASLWFWRDRAATATERLAAERASARRERGGDARIERALGALVKLGPRERWARLGRLFASSGPFAAWAVATAASDANASPGVAAASMRDAGEALVIEGRSALAETIRRRVVFVRSAAGRRVGDFCEDRWFREFADYLCVPFEGGAIALASARPLETAARERAMALAARVGAVCAGWTASEQARRMRELVRTLGLRLFGAAEAERARIARDLHDDHAQMLAAARLALDSKREQARAIFGRLEKELRRRLNELRPAELGKRTLAAALRAELDRLAAGGIAARLKGAAAANRLPAAVRQVCYRAAREALANVVRHADATRVEVLIERDGPLVRLVVSDNGRGIDPRTSPHDGAGLGGLGERLQFVGGAMRIESKRGLTRLIAEIPLA
ncbi:MAG TPA: ATP-binding protein [Candidatus Binataceae bacterium]|nr:ATP-binding protein [Candidatus Binataceae bacterium]